jgi:dihydroneopterin aldolase/2-amino-4-hydroxy-6-hydroxymethyldihydropteridine diphosphokinase
MATSRSYDLIETLARDIAGRLLEHPLVRKASVRVSKPEAPVGVPVESVSVTVGMERSGSRGHFTGEGEGE